MQYENVEQSALENNNFRKVLFTNKYSQVVLMSIPPGEDIGSEVHETVDQVLVFVKGAGEAVVGAYFCAALVVLSAIDAERRILPDLIVLPSFVIVLTANMILAPERWNEWLAASLGASLFLFLALLAYPAGMGMGDVKLALLLGAGLGWTVSVGMMIGMVSALVASSILFARHGLAARKMGIPFGPFLAFGAIVALFVGQPLLDAYLSRF